MQILDRTKYNPNQPQGRVVAEVFIHYILNILRINKKNQSTHLSVSVELHNCSDTRVLWGHFPLEADLLEHPNCLDMEEVGMSSHTFMSHTFTLYELYKLWVPWSKLISYSTQLGLTYIEIVEVKISFGQQLRGIYNWLAYRGVKG